MHFTFISWQPARWSFYECCNLHKAFSPPLFSKFHDLVPRQQPGQGPVWTIDYCPHQIFRLDHFRFPVTCHQGHGGLTCHEEHMCRKEHVHMVLLDAMNWWNWFDVVFERIVDRSRLFVHLCNDVEWSGLGGLCFAEYLVLVLVEDRWSVPLL